MNSVEFKLDYFDFLKCLSDIIKYRIVDESMKIEILQFYFLT